MPRKLLEAFECTTLLYARNAAHAHLHTLEDLEACLPQMDLVFGCLPDTPATRNLLSRRRLVLLKPTAIVANGGRGSLIDEAALMEMPDSA